jgi:hypothetical protein
VSERLARKKLLKGGFDLRIVISEGSKLEKITIAAIARDLLLSI